MRYYAGSQPAVAGRAHCVDVVEYADPGHRQAIIVGDINGRAARASIAGSARNLVVLPVPLASQLRLASECFARAVVTDTVAAAGLFIAAVDFSD